MAASGWRPMSVWSPSSGKRWPRFGPFMVTSAAICPFYRAKRAHASESFVRKERTSCLGRAGRDKRCVVGLARHPGFVSVDDGPAERFGLRHGRQFQGHLPFRPYFQVGAAVESIFAGLDQAHVVDGLEWNFLHRFGLGKEALA